MEKLGLSLSDEEIEGLTRGGHDPIKVFAAYDTALKSPGPSVILAHTVKGWGIDSFEGRNSTHQKKKMDLDDLIAYRDALGLSIGDSKLQDDPFLPLEEDSDEIEYMLDCRRRLGGPLPSRTPLQVETSLPSLDTYSAFDQGTPEATGVHYYGICQTTSESHEVRDR